MLQRSERNSSKKLDLFKIICQQIEINYIVIEGLCRSKYCIIYLYDGYIFVCGYKKYGEIGVKMVYDGYNVVVGLKQYNSFWVDFNFYRYVIYIFCC